MILNFLAYQLDRALGIVLGSFVAIYIINQFGPSEYSKFALIFLMTAITSSLGTAGTLNHGVKKISDTLHQSEAAISGGLFLYILPFGIITGIINFFVVSSLTGEYFWAAFGYLFTCLNVFRYLYEAHEEFKIIAISSSLYSITSALIKFVLVGLECDWQLLACVFVFDASGPALFLGIYSALRGKLTVSRFPVSSFKAQFIGLFNETKHIIFNGVIGAASTKSDLVVLTFFAGSNAMFGGYAAITRVFGIFAIFIPLFFNVLFPRLCRALQGEGRSFRQEMIFNYRLAIAIGVLSGLSIFLFAEHLLGLILSTEYQGYYSVVKYLSPIVLLIALSQPFARYLLAKKLNHRMSRLLVLNCIFGFCVQVLMFHSDGIVGLALGMLVSMLMPYFAWSRVMKIHRRLIVLALVPKRY